MYTDSELRRIHYMDSEQSNCVRIFHKKRAEHWVLFRVFLLVRFGVRERDCLNLLEWILLRYEKSGFEFAIRPPKI